MDKNEFDVEDMKKMIVMAVTIVVIIGVVFVYYAFFSHQAILKIAGFEKIEKGWFPSLFKEIEEGVTIIGSNEEWAQHVGRSVIIENEDKTYEMIFNKYDKIQNKMYFEDPKTQDEYLLDLNVHDYPINLK